MFLSSVQNKNIYPLLSPGRPYRTNKISFHFLVETDDSGRLIDEDYRKLPLPRSIHRAIYLRHAETDGNQTFVLSDGRELHLRSEASGRVRADIELKAAARAERDQEFHLTIPEAVRMIRGQAKGCAKAFYWAEEEWASPAL